MYEFTKEEKEWIQSIDIDDLVKNPTKYYSGGSLNMDEIMRLTRPNDPSSPTAGEYNGGAHNYGQNYPGC